LVKALVTGRNSAAVAGETNAQGNHSTPATAKVAAFHSTMAGTSPAIVKKLVCLRI
jgi:hypothetical protein